MARLTSSSKYERIIAEIRSRILSGGYAVGEQIPSQNDMMRDYAVSYSTVIRALQELVKEGHLVRIQGKGTFVAKRTTRTAVGRSRLIGVSLPYVGPQNGVYGSRLLSAMESTAREYGYRMIVTCSEGDPAIERTNYEDLYNLGVDGLALWHVGGEANMDWLERFKNDSIPFILFDRYLPQYPTDYVVTNNRLGSREAVRALIDMGHRRIAFFSINEMVSSVSDRLSGYRQALSAAGMQADESLIQMADLRDISGSCLHLANHFFDRETGPIAVFSVNTAVFLAMLQAVREHGRDRDGSIALATVGNPWVNVPDEIPFVMMEQPMDKIGRKTIEALLKKIAGDASPVQVVLPPDVYIRIDGKATLDGKPVDEHEFSLV